MRKLKELGLTESIAKDGYRLSPRGQEVFGMTLTIWPTLAGYLLAIALIVTPA